MGYWEGKKWIAYWCMFLTLFYFFFLSVILPSLFSLFSSSVFSVFPYYFSLSLLAYCECPSRIAHWLAGCPVTTTILCWLRHVPFPDKGSFVLFSSFPWHSHLDKGWVFSITNFYSMHLVILAHICLFWVVCHLSRTFPYKSLSGNPKISFPILPTTRSYPLLPLTHGPPPRIGWVQVGGAWALCVLYSYVNPLLV